VTARVALPGERVDWILVAVLAAAWLSKLVVLLQLHAHPLLQPQGELDGAAYLDLARRVAGGDLLAGDRVFFISPFYVYFVAAVLAVSGGSVMAVQVVQTALGTAAVWLVAETARLWHGRTAGRLAAGLAALTGYFTFNEILVLQSAVDPCLTALGLWLAARAWLRGGLRWFAATGTVLGLHALNRPNVLGWALSAIVLTAVAPWLTSRGRTGDRGAAPRRLGGVGPALALAGGVVLAIAPVAIRNGVVAGQAAPIASHGGLNFFIGNNPDADGTFEMVDGITPSIVGQDRDMTRVASRALGRPVSDTEASGWFYGRAWAWMRGNPLKAAGLFARKLAYVFNATDLALNYSYAYFSRDERTWLSALVVGPWLLLPLGLAGLWWGRPAGASPPPADARAWWLWSAFVPVYAASVAVFFVAGRYRMPLLVALSVSSGVALARLWAMRRAGRAALAWALGLMAGLGVLCNLGLGLDDGRAEQRTEMILHEIDVGEDGAARALLVRTEPDHPAKALLLYRVGQAYLDRHDPAQAEPVLERAHQLVPGRPEVRLVLGQALLDLGRPAEAVPHLRAALDAGVRPDLAAFDLARALSAIGSPAEAISVLHRVASPEKLDRDSQAVIAQLALDLGDPPFAASILRRLVALAPDDARLHETLGLALGLLGRGPDSLAELSEACRLDPSSASARLNLAVAEAEAGRIAEARRLAEEALRLRPDYRRAAEFLAAIGGGR
jgi:tetratricopeptide (TPR) repeat protein